VDPRQLIRFERKLSTEILVLTLPEGKDPDEFLRARPGDWPALVGSAEPLLDFVMRAVVGGIDLSDPKAKSGAVGQLAPLIRELPDSIQQAHYIGLLARMLHLGEEVVASEIRRLGLVRPTRGGASSGPTQAEPAVIERRGPSREDHLLTLLLTHPDAAHELAAEIEPDDFTDAADRAVWTVTRPTVIADPRLQTADLLTAIGDPALRESAEKLITIPSVRPVTIPGPVRQEIRNTLKLLRQEANKAQIQQLQTAIAEAAQEGDMDAVRSLMEQLPALYERLRTFDPPTSPYFRDTRTVTDKR
jgi:DNA primase